MVTAIFLFLVIMFWFTFFFIKSFINFTINFIMHINLFEYLDKIIKYRFFILFDDFYI